MKIKSQFLKTVNLSSIAVKIAKKRFANIENAYMKKLKEPQDDCPACQYETAINIYLNLAAARSQMIHDDMLELADEEIISLMDERDECIMLAFDALVRKDNIDD